MSSFCLCYIALTGSVSRSLEVMNLFMIDIAITYFAFFSGIVYLFCSKKCSFLFGTYFAQNSASKIYQCLLLTIPFNVYQHSVLHCQCLNNVRLVLQKSAFFLY